MQADIKHILVVDDDEAFASMLTRALRRRGVECEYIVSLEQLPQQLSLRAWQGMVLDLKFPEATSLPMIERVLQALPELRILMLTGYASVATAVQAIKLGAFNYLAKPASTDDICYALQIEPGVAGVSEAEDLSVDRMQWEYIQQALARHEGNISATARSLGMHRRTLQRKLQKRPLSR